ncbi:hypothetical protein DFQ30_001019 [Apophysomyces sp. BC1015]|nr:hypothetical protein DFQ30_001019 [Apophysomyces sp. BC1015]
MNEFVIPGTVAEGALISMEKSRKTAAGKQAISKFRETSTIRASSIEYSAEKLRFRTSMACDVNDNQQHMLVKRRRQIDKNEHDEEESTRKVIRAEEDEEEEEGDGDGKEREGKNDIWSEWTKFLNDPTRIEHLQDLSPERHRVIWCGKSLKRRCCLPKALYDHLQEEFTVVSHALSLCLQEQTNRVLDSNDLAGMEDTVGEFRKLKVLCNSEQMMSEYKLFSAMFEMMIELYEEDNISRSEACYNGQVLHPCIRACCRMLRVRDRGVSFLPAEEELISMSKQLRKRGLLDQRFKYNADGILRLKSIANVEILLLETSSAYDSASNGKTSFDHFKGMFGLLSMLKTVADEFPLADYDIFKQLKLHFIHAHGTGIRHWTMSVPSANVYIMYKEQRVDISREFSQKSSTLLPFMLFHLDLGMALENTIQIIEKLKESHEQAIRVSRFTNERNLPSLQSFVDPIIVRLSEKHHSHLAKDMGPQSP